MIIWKPWITTYILISYTVSIWALLALYQGQHRVMAVIGASLLYAVLTWLGLQPDIKVAEEEVE